MTISERIKLIRTQSGLKQEPFAESIGMRRTNYAHVEAGKQSPTITTLTEIVRNYNIAYEWLMEGIEPMHKMAPNLAPITAPNGKKDLVKYNLPLYLPPKVVTTSTTNDDSVVMVPVKAAAGYLNGYGDPEYIESLPTMNLPGTQGQMHRAFEIRGQSMLPTHHSGSIAIGRYVDYLDEIRDRRVYILLTKNDGIVLKRVINRIKEDGKLILMSDNENKREYPNYPVDQEEILEVWYWRMSIIRESPEPGIVYNRINDLEARLSLLESRFKTR